MCVRGGVKVKDGQEDGRTEGRRGGREGGREGETDQYWADRHRVPVEGRKAMHVLRGVLQVPLSFVLVFGGEDGNGLEPAPAEGEDDGVVGL